MPETMSKQRLSEKNADPDPFKQFSSWYAEHLDTVKENGNSVSLATATASGSVSSRIVLLKGYDEKGFVFFTNYNSKKGRQLSENPNAAMLFYWPEAGRQVRIEGSAEKVSEAEASEYFSSRPRESQLAAWASEQSSVIGDRKYLEDRRDRYREEFSGTGVEKPPYWGGYRLVPRSIEFWLDGEYRMHDRILYTRNHEGWTVCRLAP
jgi:pyridoxamine 5'-phosphate oxidase